MDASKLKIIIIIALSAMIALYLGVAAATAQREAIAWIAGALCLVTFLAMGRHIWLLIPLTVPLSGMINALPGAPFPWWAAMAVVGVMYTIRFLMRRMEAFTFHFNWLDVAILIQGVAIFQAYLRNPTGFSIFGGDVVGGKPYVIFAFAMVAYALLAVSRTDIKTIRWLVIAMILVSIGDGALGIASQMIPAIAIMTVPFYSGVDFSASRGIAFESEGARLSTGKQIGQTLGTAACTLYPPIHSLLPVRIIPFLMMTSAVLLILYSGFRSALGWLMIVFIVGSLVRRRYVDVLIASIVGLVGISLLMASGMTRQLPFSIQRVLSPIPFLDVEEDTRDAAERSTDWRFEMWKLALTTDRYITNKWLGDGFNFSAAENNAAMDSIAGDNRRSAGMNMQDVMMARGSYHGFHVETIRFTGALGLVCALIAMGIWFRYALVLIRHFKGRPEWGHVIYICLPFLVYPFYYMLIFGAYRSGFPLLLVTSGVLKILDNIRVRELAEARAAVPVAPMPASSQPSAPVRSLPPGRFPHPAMRSR